MALIIIRNALFVIFLVFCSLNLYSYKIDSGELHAFTSPAVKIVNSFSFCVFMKSNAKVAIKIFEISSWDDNMNSFEYDCMNSAC